MISSIRIGPRLFLGFGIVMAMTMVMAILGWLRMSEMAFNLDEICQRHAVQLVLVNEMRVQVQVVNRVARTLAIIDDKQELIRQKAKIEEARRIYDDSDKKLVETLLLEKPREMMAALRPLRARAREINDRVIALGMGGQRKEAAELLTREAIAINQTWEDDLEELLVFFQGRMNYRYGQAIESHHQAQRLIIGFSIGTLLVGLSLAYFFTRSVTRPLVSFGKALEAVAKGDFRASVEIQGRDELAEMGGSLNETIARLREAMLGIQDSAFTIAQASGQISSGNADLSARTEEQAASLQETASSLEQFTGSVNQTFENTRSAASAAASAGKAAQQGRTAVEQMLATMVEINSTSNRIAEIIVVVDEISFQTNILALNAAVEAARAGDQGRGFAVVATEVRNLARRSAEAAKEIKTLIRQSVLQAQAGQDMASRNDEQILKMAGDVQQVSEIINEIAQAAKEQTVGINEINKAVLQMDDMTQQNAALVEESAAAAEHLDDQARALAEISARFQTGKDFHFQERQRPRSVADPKMGRRKPSPALKSRNLSPSELVLSKTPAVMPPEEDGLWESF